MEFQENVSLKNFNTFGINVYAEYLVEVDSSENLKGILAKANPSLILGGGSNILFTKNVEGLVMLNRIAGKEVINTNHDETLVQFGGGENWHDCVLWSLEKGLGGIENLSLIPGCTGAAPIQNIGAYGVELKDVFESLEAIHIPTRELHRFDKKDCNFGYRDSVFKHKYADQYCITSITLNLKKDQPPNISYGAITETLDKMGVDEITPKTVSDAVIAIRSSKLPDPAELGNAGSFFKNPVILKGQFDKLFKEFPDIVHYPQPGGLIKVPAGWLIEQCGWKGKRVGNTGAHARQALVLVNYGGASGSEIRDLAWKIAGSVYQKFGILLVPEVNVL